MGPYTTQALAEQRARAVQPDGLDHANRSLAFYEQVSTLHAFMRDEMGLDELADFLHGVGSALKNPDGPTARALLEALRRLGHTS